MLNKNLIKGFSLIEALLGLLILAVVSTVIISLSLQVSSLINSTKLKNQAVATSLQLLEQTRGYYQQNGWAGLLAAAPTSPICYTDGTLVTTVACNATGQNTLVKLTTGGGSPPTWLKTEVTVKWSWRGQEQNIVDQTYFYFY